MSSSRQPILVCYDGSPGAVRAAQAASTMFPGQPAIVLFVWPGIAAERVRTTSVERVREELIEEVRVSARRDATAIAEEGAELARRAGLAARPLAVQSRTGAADVIVRVARQESVAAVVVGRSRGARRGWLGSGGILRHLVDDCPMPLVVV